MQYLLLIHNDATSRTPTEKWTALFARAQASGMFRGGSEVGRRELLGSGKTTSLTAHIVGFMRFDAEDKEALLDLLQSHPVVVHGGTVELCEMPKS